MPHGCNLAQRWKWFRWNWLASKRVKWGKEQKAINSESKNHRDWADTSRWVPGVGSQVLWGCALWSSGGHGRRESRVWCSGRLSWGGIGVYYRDKDALKRLSKEMGIVTDPSWHQSLKRIEERALLGVNKEIAREVEKTNSEEWI